MGKFENKEIGLKFEEDKQCGFADLVIICLNQIPEGGILPLEMSDRIDTIKQMKALKVGKTIELNEKQLTMIKNCSNTTRWMLIHEDIDAFNKYLLGLK